VQERRALPLGARPGARPADDRGDRGSRRADLRPHRRRPRLLLGLEPVRRARQSGGAAPDDRATPVEVASLSGATAIAMGRYQSCATAADGTVCARLSDGALWCSGANGSGQLGIGEAGASVYAPAPALIACE
jgi:hypothetical protein